MHRLARPLIATIAPVALALGLILGDFAPLGIPIDNALRGLVAAALIALIAYTVALAVLRDRAGASYAGSLVIVLAYLAPTWSMLIALGGVLIVIVMRLFRVRPPRLPAAPLMIGSLAFAAFGAVSVAANGGLQTYGERAATGTDGPPIYVMLLDGYPRADVLDGFGFDNLPFLTGLHEHGFDVAPRATSNYTTTQLTLASMLHMRHVAEIDALANVAPADETRALGQLISEGGPLLDVLHEHGYNVATIPSIVGDVEIRSAERLGRSHISYFEIDLLTTTALGRIVTSLLPDLLADNHRASVVGAFETLVAEQDAGRFIWMHVMSPHPPYVFGPGGEPKPLPPCENGCPYFHGSEHDTIEDVTGQVQFVNRLVIDTVQRLDPTAVIVVMSDHGIGVTPEDRFANLLAVRAPGHANIVPDDASAITVLPRVLNAYLNADLSIPADEHYAVRSSKLDLVSAPR